MSVLKPMLSDRVTEQSSDQGEQAERFDPIVNHYVPKAQIMRSLVEGTPATALCGAVDVIKSRGNGQTHEATKGVLVMCPLCSHIYDGLPTSSPSSRRDEGARTH